MPVFNDYLEKAAKLMDYVTACIDLPMYAASCRPLWHVVMYASVGFGAIVIAWVFWIANSRSRQLMRAPELTHGNQHPASPSRKRPVPDTGVDLADVTDLQLAIKIRQELERQRIRNITGR